jgi:hypothetical protein
VFTAACTRSATGSSTFACSSLPVSVDHHMCASCR